MEQERQEENQKLTKKSARIKSYTPSLSGWQWSLTCYIKNSILKHLT